MKFYQYQKCESCRKARKWLDQNGYSYKSIEIRESPPTAKELKGMLAKHGGEFKKLFNTSSKDYRDPEVKDKLAHMSENEILSFLSSRGNLIKRPFLIGKNLHLQGFKAEIWEHAFQGSLQGS